MSRERSRFPHPIPTSSPILVHDIDHHHHHDNGDDDDDGDDGDEDDDDDKTCGMQVHMISGESKQ